MSDFTDAYIPLIAPTTLESAALDEIAIQLKRIADRLEMQFPTEAERQARIDDARVNINQKRTARP